jgi:hypothetical protein
MIDGLARQGKAAGTSERMIEVPGVAEPSSALQRISAFDAAYCASSNEPFSRMSLDEDPTHTSNAPGSATQSFFAGS